MLRLKGASRRLFRPARFFCSSSNPPSVSLFSDKVEGSGPTGIAQDAVGRAAPCSTSDGELQLRKDVKLMGTILGDCIKTTSNSGVFEKVEKMRSLTKAWRDDQGNQVDLSAVVDEVSTFSNADIHATARAFNHFLRLANSAESHQR